MTVLAFTVTFHGPFRVGAAYARDGISAPLDHHDPLPADHLKGVMRAAAVQLLGARDHPAIGAVFGSPRSPSPWSWSHAVPADGDNWAFSPRHRVKIDAEHHSAVKDYLVVGEQAWASAARFTVTRVARIPRQPHDASPPEEVQVAVLRCAAAGVHGLGGWRRRGLGWVGIAPEGDPVTAADIGIIQALTQAAEGARP